MRFWRTKPVPKGESVGIGVACYFNNDLRRVHALFCLIESFRAQTWTNWKLLLVHDGPILVDKSLLLSRIQGDPKIELIETKERKNDHGHSHRPMAIEKLSSHPWLMLTNDDNYYMPVFLEWLLATGNSAKVSVVYCDMIHSHKQWKAMPTNFRYRHLDLGGFIVRSSLAKQVPFTSVNFNADGDWIDRLAAKATKRSIRKVNATLFCHN